MSYLNQVHDPRRRATAIVTVGAVHALLAAGLLTGLAVNFDRVVEPRLIGTIVPLDQPTPLRARRRAIIHQTHFGRRAGQQRPWLNNAGRR